MMADGVVDVISVHLDMFSRLPRRGADHFLRPQDQRADRGSEPPLRSKMVRFYSRNVSIFREAIQHGHDDVAGVAGSIAGLRIPRGPAANLRSQGGQGTGESSRARGRQRHAMVCGVPS